MKTQISNINMNTKYFCVVVCLNSLIRIQKKINENQISNINMSTKYFLFAVCVLNSLARIRKKHQRKPNQQHKHEYQIFFVCCMCVKFFGSNAKEASTKTKSAT